MRVVMLGTGGSAGVPLIGGVDGRGNWGLCDPAEPRNRRTRASIVVDSAAGSRLLVDTSPDMRSQLLACAIPSVDAILFTHAHADHITGLDDVRILNRIVDRPLEAFATQQTLDELKHRFGYAFKPWTGPGFFRPALAERRVEPGEICQIAGFPVQLFSQNHGFTTSLGLRIGSFGYSTDVVGLDDAAFDLLAGVDTWVVDCFQRLEPHNTHAHLELAVTWAKRVGARRTLLTHMGPEMDWGWLCANLPAGIEPAHDGMILEIPS
jgi:phosphoribosyl 1,2-cyclic phosphate phosphodiesterase